MIRDGLSELAAAKETVDAGTLAYVRAYGLFRLATVSNRKDQRQARLQEADHLLAQPPRPEWAAEFHALRSAIDGLLAGSGEVALSIRYGIASQQEADKALHAAPDNGRALIAFAQAKGNTPEAYGGSRPEAIERLKQAATVFSQHSSDGIFGWGEADAYAWLGVFYLEEKNLPQARSSFNSALKIRPDFFWVKDYLLPKMDGQPVHPKFPKGQPSD
jgi:tetratricopeptide (TPR) repeat protein